MCRISGTTQPFALLAGVCRLLSAAPLLWQLPQIWQLPNQLPQIWQATLWGICTSSWTQTVDTAHVRQMCETQYCGITHIYDCSNWKKEDNQKRWLREVTIMGIMAFKKQANKQKITYWILNGIKVFMYQTECSVFNQCSVTITIKVTRWSGYITRREPWCL